MQQQRSKLKAFFLNLIPGAGHYYMGKRPQGIAYLLLSFGVLFMSFLIAVAEGAEEILIVGVIGFLLLWIVSMVHLVVKMLQMPAPTIAPDGSRIDFISVPVKTEDNERVHVILLSFIPGLGHFHMGLMQRGLSFLISFFGFMTVMLFLAGITSSDAFLLLFGVLPVIWLYCMFDAVQLIHRKQAGEEMVDRTLFEEMEAGREEGRRSKVLATLLSAFPGAGQMYLGLQKRGLQLMLLFLGSIYVMDLLRLTLLFFLIPVIWFYSLFDGLQLVSRHGREPLQDKPVIEGFLNHQGWLGAALMCLGLYYIVVNVAVPALDIRFPEWRLEYRVNEYFRTIVVSVLLIGGGLKLMAGSKNNKGRKGTGGHS
ncbi:TM2 domain protein [compost metagenome]